MGRAASARAPAFAPATRWATSPPWLAEPGWGADRGEPQPASGSSAQVLATLLRQDVRRGHVNLAIRHFLMLRACNLPVPPDLREGCEGWLERCPPARRLAIDAQVRRWADMVVTLPSNFGFT